VIAAASGVSYEAFLEREFFAPLWPPQRFTRL
jgi:hypothetical protein